MGAKWWGKPGAQKFYVPTGKKDDSPWTQDVCWKGALNREFSMAKHKKEDIEVGADIEAMMRSKDFLRHEGASRDSQRTGLNTRRPQGSEGEKTVHSTIPSARRSTARRGGSKQVLHGLLADSQELKKEFKELRTIFMATEKRIQQLEEYQ